MSEYSSLFQRVLNSSNQSKENSIGENVETFSKLDTKYQPTSRTTDPNEYAALNQTKLDIAGNILARGVGTFVTGALGTVAMLHDIPKSVFKAVTGDSDKHEGWDYYMNDSINADLSEAQEYVMKEYPLYDTYKDSKTPFTAKKVLDGITQGAAFIGSAYVGGWLTKGILQSAKLLGNSQKLINFTGKTGKSLSVDNAVNAQINNYLDKGKNVGAAIYNRSFESMLEAKGTGQEIREKLESENQEAFDNTGQYLYNPEDIDNRVRQAEKLNFGFNLALGVIDAYQNLKIFDGFESKIGKAISKNIDDITENVLSNKNLSKFGLPKVGATIVKYGTKSGALSTTGGLEALEELAQFSSNKLSQDLATNNYTKDDWDNLPKLITGIVGQMTDDIQNDPNAQFSALIGGLVGLPMGMVAKRSEDKQEALKSKQREIAQQSLIEKNVLVGLYKIKNGKTLEDKVSGEIQTRFSNHQGFQNLVINQINADNFEGLISHLENIKETSIDDLKELEIGVKTDSKGNIIQPSTIINEAIEQAKSVKKVYENVNLAHANKSELVRNNITNLILNGKYFDKKIDLVTNELETKKAEILAKITKDQNYAEKAFKTVKSKETGKEDLSFFVNGEIKNANIEELDINPETKDEIIKLKEELKQLNKEREFTIKEYNKYREPSYIGKVEKEAQKNIENLEKPIEQPVENTTDYSVEKPVVTNESVAKESIVSTPTDTTKDDKKIQYNSLLNNKKAYEYHLKNAKTPEDKLKIEEALLKIEEQLKQFSEYNPVDKNTSEKVTDNLTYLQDTYDKFKNNIKNASINKLYYILEKIRENYKLSQRALSQLKLEELEGNPPTQEDYDIVMLIQKINKSKLDLVEELIVKHEIEEENKKLKEPLLIEEFSTSTGEIKFALRQKEIEQAFKQNTVQDISEDGRVFNINDKQYRIGYSDMLMAINRNVNGDIISVELLNDKNETVTFRSQPLLDEIVFNILATKLTNKDFTSEIEVDNETLNEIEEKIQNNDRTDLENDLIEIQELINQLEEVIEFEKNEFIEAGFSKKEVKEYINQSKNYKTLQDLKEVEKEILKQIKVLNKPVKIKTVKEKVKKIAVKKPIVKKEKVTKVNQNDDITTETGNVTSETPERTIEQIIEGEEQNNAKLSSETEVNESIDTSTDNTYFEAPDTFLSASQANAEDILVPENLVEELPTNSSEELSDEVEAKKAEINDLVVKLEEAKNTIQPQAIEVLDENGKVVNTSDEVVNLTNKIEQKKSELKALEQNPTTSNVGENEFDKVPVYSATREEGKVKEQQIFDILDKVPVGTKIKTEDGFKVVIENITSKTGARTIAIQDFTVNEDGSLLQGGIEFITTNKEGKLRVDYNPHNVGTNSKGERVVDTDILTNEKVDLTTYDIYKYDNEQGKEVKIQEKKNDKDNTSNQTETEAKKADIERLEKEKQETLQPLIEEKEQIEKEIEEIEKATDSREEKGKRNNIVPISTKEAERLLKHLSKKYGILGVLTDLLPEFTYGKFTTEKILINKNTYYDEKGDITFESKGFVNKTTIYHEYLHPFVQILERVNPELYEKIYQDSLSSDIDVSHYIKDVRKEERVVRYLDKLSAQEKTPSLLQQFFDFLSDLFFKNKKSDYRTLQKLNTNTTVEELYNIFKNYGNLREGSEKVKEERFLKLEATQLENLINLNAGDVESHKTELEIIKQKLDLLNRYDVDKLQQLKQKLAEVNKKIDEVTKRFNAQIAQKQAELKALDSTTDIKRKLKEIPENPKLKYKTFDSNEPMFVNKEFIYFDGKTYTSYKFDEQAASTIIKDSDLVLKPLTNNGFGSIGVFTTGKDGKLVSILRQELNNKDRRVGSPTYGLDEGETGTGFLTSKKTQELFEEFFGQPFENNGILKDINKRGKLKEKEVKAFNVSFNSLNIGSSSTVTLKPTVETLLSNNIHYDNNGVPTIVRLKGKGDIEPVIITGDMSIPVDKIQLSKENKVGDTILLFTERNAHNNPNKQVYPAVPVTVKSIGETNTFKNKVTSLLNETVTNIQEYIKNGKEGKLNETVSKSNDLVIENLYKEIKNIIRLGDGTVNLKRNKNNSKTFILEGVFVIDKLNKKTETIEIEITKDSIQGLEEFKDKLMKVIPSFSVESIQTLKESGKFDVNDYLEAMTIAVKEDHPIKGVSIEIFTGSNKKDVIPSMTIKKKLTSDDLTFKDTDDLNSLLNLEVAQKTSDEKPTSQNILQDIGDDLINEEIEDEIDIDFIGTKSDKKINFKKEINKLTENTSDNDLFNIDEFINNSTHMEDSIRLSAIKDYLKGDENALIKACK